MINRKIAMSAMSIVVAMALMSGATFAFFTDTATSANNTFTTGNANLQIANDSSNAPVAYLDTIPGFSGSNLYPGSSNNYAFWLRNASTSTISLSNVADLIVTAGSEAMQDALSVTFTCTRGDSVVTVAGPFSVNQWEAGSASIGTLIPGDGIGNGTGADEARCVMNVSLPTSADNNISGQTISFDGVLDATQAL